MMDHMSPSSTLDLGTKSTQGSVVLPTELSCPSRHSGTPLSHGQRQSLSANVLSGASDANTFISLIPVGKSSPMVI